MTIPEIAKRLKSQYNKRSVELTAQLEEERQTHYDELTERIREVLLNELVRLKLMLDDDNLAVLESYNINAFAEIELAELIDVCYRTVEVLRDENPHQLAKIGMLISAQYRKQWPKK